MLADQLESPPIRTRYARRFRRSIAGLGVISIALLILRPLLEPLARRFLRWRGFVVASEVNPRLALKLPAFALSRRHTRIARLLGDPVVQDAVRAYANEHAIAHDLALAQAATYAREIVPAFNAFLYFRVAMRLARLLARSLYHVRVGYRDAEALAAVNPRASVVFVMNHRSNMDYVLLAYLTSPRAALSFAVGEWARVWPLQPLIQAMGAYFVRRGSGDALYRRVLERYVQMAIDAGVPQAIFPEGRLSRDGALGEPRVGLLDYMLRHFDPHGPRDLVFVPVAVNYERVLEDATLVQSGHGTAVSRRASTYTTLALAWRGLCLMLTGRWGMLGYAVVNVGRPISLRGYMLSSNFDYRHLVSNQLTVPVEQLAVELMRAVGAEVPVLPLALVASIFVREPDRTHTFGTMMAGLHRLSDQLVASGAHIFLPLGDLDADLHRGLELLVERGLLRQRDGVYHAIAGKLDLLSYYARSIEHFQRR